MHTSASGKPFLMGLETEYGLAGVRRGRKETPETLPPESVAAWLLSGMQQSYPNVADGSSAGGAYLANGARLYADINGHPEYATPECFTPRQVALYDKVGERILSRLAKQLRERNRLSEVRVIKNNLSSIQPDQHTWGNHESYTCWTTLESAASAIIPHLVTRLMYAGSGCLSAADGGLGLELSQRARHIRQVLGTETTHSRAIFCTRLRKHSDLSPQGWKRAHLIGKDSQRAPLGAFLTMGVTGLLFWIHNQAEGAIGGGLALASPVEALQTISRDPHLTAKVRLSSGKVVTALDIQESYLAQCEEFGKRHGLPEFADELIPVWRTVLERLRRDPMSLAGELDAYTKLAVYGHELDRCGMSWQELHRGLRLLRDLRMTEGAVEALLAQESSQLSPAATAAMPTARERLSRDGEGGMDRLVMALKMQTLELKYHELDGLYERLTAARPHQIWTLPEEEIEAAIDSPPPGGRAAHRGRLVREHSSDRQWMAAWDCLVNRHANQQYEMRDPFLGEPRLTPVRSIKDPADDTVVADDDEPITLGQERTADSTARRSLQRILNSMVSNLPFRTPRETPPRE